MGHADHHELDLQLRGYGLTTAEILYRMPDTPSVLQTYVWQAYDLAPHFPELAQFLDLWRRTLDWPLPSVRYAHQHLIGPSQWRHLSGVWRLH